MSILVWQASPGLCCSWELLALLSASQQPGFGERRKGGREGHRQHWVKTYTGSCLPGPKVVISLKLSSSLHSWRLLGALDLA